MPQSIHTLEYTQANEIRLNSRALRVPFIVTRYWDSRELNSFAAMNCGQTLQQLHDSIHSFAFGLAASKMAVSFWASMMLPPILSLPPMNAFIGSSWRCGDIP
jgi:hypothetical protein